MEEQQNLNISNKTEANEKEQPKALTFEIITSDRDVLDKIYENLNSPELDMRKEIDFGNEYQKTSINTIVFYICYYFGLSPMWQDSVDGIGNYLRALHDKPEEAGRFLEKVFLAVAQNNPDDVLKLKEKAQIIRDRGFDLSSIIPGMPHLVMDEINEKNEGLDFLGRGTTKVDGIVLDKYRGPDGEKVKALIEFFRGKTVIELGAGELTNGLSICDALEAGNYIAVEPYNADKLLNYIEMYFSNVKNINKIHVAKTDMLTFLSHIPDKTDNLLILISGIDEHIMRTSFFNDEQTREAGFSYSTKVESEISKKLSAGGIVVCYASNFDFADEVVFDRVGVFDGPESPVYVYRKKIV